MGRVWLIVSINFFLNFRLVFRHLLMFLSVCISLFIYMSLSLATTGLLSLSLYLSMKHTSSLTHPTILSHSVTTYPQHYSLSLARANQRTLSITWLRAPRWRYVVLLPSPLCFGTWQNLHGKVDTSISQTGIGKNRNYDIEWWEKQMQRKNARTH